MLYIFATRELIRVISFFFFHLSPEIFAQTNYIIAISTHRDPMWCDTQAVEGIHTPRRRRHRAAATCSTLFHSSVIKIYKQQFNTFRQMVQNAKSSRNRICLPALLLRRGHRVCGNHAVIGRCGWYGRYSLLALWHISILRITKGDIRVDSTFYGCSLFHCSYNTMFDLSHSASPHNYRCFLMGSQIALSRVVIRLKVDCVCGEFGNPNRYPIDLDRTFDIPQFMILCFVPSLV
jgi:hypothetical protein